MTKSKSMQGSKKIQKKTSRVKQVAKKEEKVGEASGSAATARTRRSKNSKPNDGKQGHCTNYSCQKTWDTTWRKGPLGPRTLCNACGLQYIKIVRSKGSGVTNSPASASDDQKNEASSA